MAKGHHTAKRPPRVSGPASDCVSYNVNDPSTITSFTPKPKKLKRTSVVQLPNGELIVRVSDL